MKYDLPQGKAKHQLNEYDRNWEYLDTNYVLEKPSWANQDGDYIKEFGKFIKYMGVHS